jgi:riboflavin kinase/FMN adenylyltransferase
VYQNQIYKGGLLMRLETLSPNLEAEPIIIGTVVKGRQLGKKIGFPTANIDVNTSWLNNGVFGVVVMLNDSFHLGVMNVGVKPTVDANLQKTVEIFILNFHDDIYGEKLGFNILFKIRDEKRFDSLELLTKQIKEDILYAKKRFKLIGLTSTSKENGFANKQLFKSS